MAIPTSFKLINRTYSVEEMLPEVADAMKALGRCDYDTATITLKTEQDPEALESTFYHELAHALLALTTKPKLTYNEDLVESLGSVLMQYMQTKKGRFE